MEAHIESGLRGLLRLPLSFQARWRTAAAGEEQGANCEGCHETGKVHEQQSVFTSVKSHRSRTILTNEVMRRTDCARL